MNIVEISLEFAGAIKKCYSSKIDFLLLHYARTGMNLHIRQFSKKIVFLFTYRWVKLK